MNKFKVVIVGRPNVGKSSLFNRIFKKRRAIVHEKAGTTRDLISETFVSDNKCFELVDTAGYLHEKGNDIIEEALLRAKKEIEKADLVWLVVDGKVTPTSQDLLVAEILRKSGKNTFLIINKVDNKKSSLYASDYIKLGFKKYFLTSVIHNQGIADVLSQTLNEVKTKKSTESETTEKPTVKATLIGRPNVGKSSIFNIIINSQKSIVADIPGTTRDVVCERLPGKEADIIFCDTGGARKPGKIGRAFLSGEPVEKYAYLRTESEVEASDIILMVIDAEEGLTAQDLHLAGKAKELGKGIILIINKWDLTDTITQEDFLKRLQKSFGFMAWVPVIFVSAKTGRNISEIIPLVLEIFERRNQEFATPKLNRILEDYALSNRPKGLKNIYPKVFFITQTEKNPPTFSIAAKNHGYVHFSWKRGFENELRRHFDFIGTPIKIDFKSNKRQ